MPLPANHKELDIQYKFLEFYPGNAKTPLKRARRRGLVASLSHFGLITRLIVWEIPEKPGYYYVLNGNKRLELVREMIVAKCNAQGMRPAKIDAEVAETWVPCQLADLSPDDAKLLVTTYDRNMAAFDETIQAQRVAELRQSHSEAIRLGLERMARPPKLVVEPGAVTAMGASQDALKAAIAAAGRASQPTTTVPYSGPEWADFDAAPAAAEPPIVDNAAPPSSFLPACSLPARREATAFISSPASAAAVATAVGLSDAPVPLVFTVSPEGYSEIQHNILRCKTKAWREKKIRDALKVLDRDLSDDQCREIVVETALRVLNAHINNEARVQN